MTREEARKVLGEGATEEQINNLLTNMHEKEKDSNKTIKELQDKLGQYSDYDTIKSKLDEIEKANMSEQEKLEEMKKETEKNLSESRIIVNKAKAMEILAGEDIDEDIIMSLVSDNMENTIAKATKMKTTLTNLKDSVAKTTKENLTTQDITPNISNVNQNENKIDFDKFSNMTSEEQEKFINEHPDEFAKF